MDEQVRKALEAVSDSYDDFVNCYVKDLRGDEDKQKMLLEYLKENPSAQTDDVIEFVEDNLLGE